jgi:predicted Rossmann fold flavoprotein
MTCLETDVVILGAGAAGMMCAAIAGQRGRQVVLIDHAKKLAEKIRISGGGRCNFTNITTSHHNFLSENPHFCRSALAQYTPQDFIALMQKHGLHYHEKKLGQLFCDEQSTAIIQMLKQECDRANVTWQMQTTLQSLKHEKQHFIVHTNQGSWKSTCLVVATGGLSIPQIGASALGYQIAEQFGLPIIPPTPALVPLSCSPDTFLSQLAGVALEDVVIHYNNIAFREAMLFTHRGLSGPAILQISSYWQPGHSLTIDLLPDKDPQTLLLQANRDSLLTTALAEYLPKRFVQAWCEAHTLIKPLKQYSPKEVSAIAQQLKNWRIQPTGTLGYKKAEVTRGGVDTQALSSKTLESKQVPGLYFIGEVVDVTGWLGGYNFQWAWSSGYAAGCHV